MSVSCLAGAPGSRRVRLLTAGQEVELARRIEAGLFAGRKLAAAGQDLAAGARAGLEQVTEEGRTARDHLVEANLRLVPYSDSLTHIHPHDSSCTARTR